MAHQTVLEEGYYLRPPVGVVVVEGVESHSCCVDPSGTGSLLLVGIGWTGWWWWTEGQPIMHLI